MKTATAANNLLLFDDIPTAVTQPLVSLPAKTDDSAVLEDGKLVIYVPVSRLRTGDWDHEKQRTVGAGDIGAAYSADVLMEGKLRRPFIYQGRLMTNTGGLICQDYYEWTAYEIIPAELFHGEVHQYKDRNVDCGVSDADRRYRTYHGLCVMHGGKKWVLVGPEITFKPCDAERPKPAWTSQS